MTLLLERLVTRVKVGLFQTQCDISLLECSRYRARRQRTIKQLDKKWRYYVDIVL